MKSIQSCLSSGCGKENVNDDGRRMMDDEGRRTTEDGPYQEIPIPSMLKASEPEKLIDSSLALT